MSVTIEQALGSRYVLEARISSGGMGEIWRGRDLPAGRPVAVKVLHERLASDPTELARFLRERTILTGLDHPNLVPVRDMIMEGGRLALVMDLVEGPDMHHYLRAHGPLPPALAVTLISQACVALAVVHAAGIVHRDLKPSNILLDTSQSPPIARLTDFGIAQAEDALPLTAKNLIIGTPQYCAPEAIAGERGGTAVDVYAAGITLYELLVGQPPFAGGPASTVFWRHLDAEPLRPPEVPEPLWTVIAACLAKDPEQRPSAETAARLLRECLPALRDALPAVLTPGARWFTMPSQTGYEEEKSQFDPPAPTTVAHMPSPAGGGPGPVRRGRRPTALPATAANLLPAVAKAATGFTAVAGVAAVLTAAAGVATAAWLTSNYGHPAPQVSAGSHSSAGRAVTSPTALPQAVTPPRFHRTPPASPTRHARVPVPASSASGTAPPASSVPTGSAMVPVSASPPVSSRPASPTPTPPPSDVLLYSFEDGTADGWQAGANVASVGVATSLLNGPGHPYDGNYALQAVPIVGKGVSAQRTVSVAPASPLNLSAAQSFFVAVDGFGGAPGATGYRATITLSGGNQEVTGSASIQPDAWTKLVIPISTWAYRDQITSISVSYAGVGSSAVWEPAFQVDDVGYTT